MGWMSNYWEYEYSVVRRYTTSFDLAQAYEEEEEEEEEDVLAMIRPAADIVLSFLLVLHRL